METLLDLNLILFLIIHPLVIGALSLQGFRANRGLLRWAAPALLLPWFAGVAWFSTQPAAADFSSLPPPSAIAIAVPLIIGLALLAFSARYRAFLAGFSPRWLIAVQVYRVLGYGFLVAWLIGRFPTEIGLITGTVDIVIGISAIWVMRRFSRRRALAWNVLGLIDFAWVVPITLLASPTPLQAIALTPGVEAMGSQPFVLIAMWAVPFSILLHAASLYQLTRRADQRTAQPHAATDTDRLHMGVSR